MIKSTFVLLFCLGTEEQVNASDVLLSSALSSISEDGFLRRGKGRLGRVSRRQRGGDAICGAHPLGRLFKEATLKTATAEQVSRAPRGRGAPSRGLGATLRLGSRREPSCRALPRGGREDPGRRRRGASGAAGLGGGATGSQTRALGHAQRIPKATREGPERPPSTFAASPKDGREAGSIVHLLRRSRLLALGQRVSSAGREAPPHLAAFGTTASTSSGPSRASALSGASGGNRSSGVSLPCIHLTAFSLSISAHSVS